MGPDAAEIAAMPVSVGHADSSVSVEPVLLFIVSRVSKRQRS